MAKKDLSTGISSVKPGKVLIRGYDLIKLMDHFSFGEMIYLLFTERFPKKNEGRMIEAILVCSAEHGMATPSTNVVRSVASCGVPLQATVASGIICLGDYHGGAIEGCAKMLQSNVQLAREKGFESAASEIATRSRESKKRIMGYGHGIHQPEDPRKTKLFQLAEKYGVAGDHMKLADALEGAMQKVLQKSFPLNVDGAIAAIISDLGIDWRYGKAFFYIGRSAGLTAHAFEYMVKESPMRRVYSWDEVSYVGPEERDIPE
jgi:citrate synthase